MVLVPDGLALERHSSMRLASKQDSSAGSSHWVTSKYQANRRKDRESDAYLRTKSEFVRSAQSPRSAPHECTCCLWRTGECSAEHYNAGARRYHCGHHVPPTL